MYNVLDVAIYVINYAHDTGCGESMNNLKLQKILYYIQVVAVEQIKIIMFNL